MCGREQTENANAKEDQLQQMQSEIKELTETITEYKNVIRMRERELDHVNEMNFSLIEMSKVFEQEKDFWQSMFYDIQNSTSWRVTKGLRLVGSLFKHRK